MSNNLQPVMPPEITGKQNFPVNQGRWKNLVARLYAAGSRVEDLAQEFEKDVGEITAWLTSDAGRKLVVQFAGEGRKASSRILEGQRITNILALVRLRDTAKSDAARLGAATQIQKMLDSTDGISEIRTPEDQKIALENALKKIYMLQKEEK